MRVVSNTGPLIGLAKVGRLDLLRDLFGEVLLLMDDRAGRNVAKKLGIPKTGLVGLLLIAKERKAVPNVASILHLLRKNGYWLSDALVQRAKNLAGEEG